MKKIIFIALALIIAVYLLCFANGERTRQKPEENEGLPSENWKEYHSIVGIWPRLKKEGIESIRFCSAFGLEYGEDNESDFWGDANTPDDFLGKFNTPRERAADVVRWWPSGYAISKENLTECIKIIDKTIKKVKKNGPHWMVSPSTKMLIVTKKGRYIVHVEMDISEVAGPKVYGEEWMSRELGKFIAKYCIQAYKQNYFISPEEQTVAIVIFTHKHPKSGYDSMLIWPPIALFGDKKEAEKLLNRSFEPKMIFEGRDWLEKIIDAHEIAFNEAKEANYPEKGIHATKGWIVFLTQDKFYWHGIGINENSVLEDYKIESKQLKAYFDELGLTDELLTGEPNKVSQD